VADISRHSCSSLVAVDFASSVVHVWTGLRTVSHTGANDMLRKRPVLSQDYDGVVGCTCRFTASYS